MQTYARLLLVVALYYLAYRYPLQINASTTSPTYTDTPLLFQVGKYAICLGLAGWFTALALLTPSGTTGQAIVVILIAYLVAIGSLASFATGDLAHLEHAIFLLVAVPLLIKPVEVNVDGILRWFVYLNTLAFVVQWALFIFFGRLPALAYHESYFVRFGGIWDDPNGMGVFLSFIIPYIYFNFSGFKKWLLLILNGLALISTQSFTAMLSFGAALFIVPVVYFLLTGWIPRGIPRLSWLGIFVGVVLVITALLMVPDLAYIVSEYMDDKWGSVEGHRESLDVLRNMTLMNFFGLQPNGYVGESGYGNLILNLGILPTLMAGALILTVFVGAALSHNYPVAFFAVTFGVAMFNLPLTQVFPVNLLLILFGVISVQARLYRLASSNAEAHARATGRTVPAQDAQTP